MQGRELYQDVVTEVAPETEPRCGGIHLDIGAVLERIAGRSVVGLDAKPWIVVRRKEVDRDAAQGRNVEIGRRNILGMKTPDRDGERSIAAPSKACGHIAIERVGHEPGVEQAGVKPNQAAAEVDAP